MIRGGRVAWSEDAWPRVPVAGEWPPVAFVDYHERGIILAHRHQRTIAQINALITRSDSSPVHDEHLQ